MAKIQRAIMSCHDKAGLVELAGLLQEQGVEIISTAGTLQVLVEAGINAVNMADYTGIQEMMDGRVKSLHSKVHAGLLGIRDNKVHVEQLQAAAYEWIDLVVANLHPVEAVIRQPGITPDEVVEQIDIGGMAMIRSAAKNFRYVTVVVNPARYSAVMHELRAHDGEVTFATRYRLAQEAFACTAQYDQIIADYLRSAEPKED
ncbi:MAG: IMP cyclohydrolase [Candidatus Hydrogenedentes bacterium]|nr:IMP cyclohydrolase [Candidatus Hydrogenedentota bacterium]